MTRFVRVPTLVDMAGQNWSADPTTDLTKRRTVDLCRVSAGLCCMP